MSARAVLVAAALALAAVRPAAADDLWRSLARTADDLRTRQEHDRAMLAGDDAVDSALNTDIVSVRQRLIDRALAAYAVAARARPDDPEPHYRAASVLRGFHADCADRQRQRGEYCAYPLTPAREARLLEHWDAFERLAPGDPRVFEEVLFERALLLTRRAQPADLRRARDDYRKIVDLQPDSPDERVLGNLAETHMMLGDIDEAIITYRQSLRRGAELSQEYGLAVALDRDEQGTEARAIMAARGQQGLARFQFELLRHSIFFVPEGEEQYYLALAHESLGMVDDAVDAWNAFLESGAHPQFHERARANRDALLRELASRPRPRLSPRPPRPTAPRWRP